jgi:uncharacterized protein (TIGR02145 family)
METRSKIWNYSLILLGFVALLANSSCRKDDDHSFAVKDIDGNIYHSVTIGTQVWMVENLKTTRYRNGDSIPNITDNYQWYNLTSGAYCNYDNLLINGDKYGNLYNWHAVSDGRNIAPVGWHVATDEEWTTLTNYVAANPGTSGSIAKVLASQTDWVSSVETGVIGNDLSKNNTSGFSALPGGYRDYSGSFNHLGDIGGWWTATEVSPSFAWFRALGYDGAGVGRDYNDKYYGFSVRCVRDN